MKTKNLLFSLSLIVLLMACNKEKFPATYDLNQAFELGFGETATLNAIDFDFTFAQVLEDSRCPEKNNCFWAGQSRIKLVICESNGDFKDSVELVLNNEGKAPVAIKYEDYLITFSAIYPRQGNLDSNDLGKYSVVLEVSELGYNGISN